jgi:predicted enzyme related to lactoylglutathione lyase
MEMTSYENGVPSRVDLPARDGERAAGFYGALLGREGRDPGGVAPVRRLRGNFPRYQ